MHLRSPSIRCCAVCLVARYVAMELSFLLEQSHLHPSLENKPKSVPSSGSFGIRPQCQSRIKKFTCSWSFWFLEMPKRGQEWCRGRIWYSGSKTHNAALTDMLTKHQMIQTDPVAEAGPVFWGTAWENGGVATM